MSAPFPTIHTPKKRVYDLAMNRGTVSKAELLDELMLTSSSLTRLLEEMIHEGILQECGLGHSTGGRRPILYQLNASYGYSFGLEISRVYSTLGLFDMHLKSLAFSRWKMDETMTPDRLIEHVQKLVQSFMDEHDLKNSQILGMGIGGVGPLNQEQGIMVKPLFFAAAGWDNFPIGRLLQEKLQFPVRLENGANTALIGEHWMLRNENVRHMLYVHAGTGLRSSMMSNGQIVYGAVDMEGSIGQMIVQVGGPRLQEEGNYGALDAFVSIQALEKQARTQSVVGGGNGLFESPLSPDRITFDTLLKALVDGNVFVRNLFVQSAFYLGIGLANLINILHPEKIILGGPLIASHELFFEEAVRVARLNLHHSAEYEPSFSLGELKEDAVATGAAVMVMRGLVL
ncbi:ROK family protein [Cohnella silvisoli]|uniref:ROK family protein n=1 Tax=Cohnella silvisoli TaxID=2873699 RepID=A0ABV1KR90_9BACL|nr:ROK family protein [Cohnella silvisoli]MCD9024549.1 ROK family protein [Cohnella silvisoli]